MEVRIFSVVDRTISLAWTGFFIDPSFLFSELWLQNTAMMLMFFAYQVRMPANEALWTTNDLLPGSSYPRVLFHKHLKLLRTAYQRFKALASIGESMSPHLDQRARFEQVWPLTQYFSILFNEK